jgi:hypothetical protein
MSWQAMNSVLANSESQGNERLLMMVLAHHADAVGFSCYPAIETIVSESKLSRATVFRVLDRLEARGELSVESGKGESGKGNRKSNRYIIKVQRSQHSETFEQSQRSHQRSQNEASKVSNSASKGLTAMRPEYKEHKEHNDRTENGCSEDLLKEKKTTRFELDVRLKYSYYLYENNLGVNEPEGFARGKQMTNGIKDDDIQAWLDEQNADAKADVEKRQKTIYQDFFSKIPTSIKTCTLPTKPELDVAISHSRLKDFPFNEKRLRSVFCELAEYEFGMVSENHSTLLDELVSIVKNLFAMPTEPPTFSTSEPVWEIEGEISF